MGCGSSSSMDIYEPRRFKDKTLLWLLGGGPGAPKLQVAKFLIERFKFKFVSASEMMAYDEKAGSPESVEIRKCMDQKQQFPSELVIKVLKRFLSLYGPRKYLIEGFPRNQADVKALNQMVGQYSRIELMGYIQIQMSEQQMKDSGVKALKERKKQESQDNIEKEVRTIIEQYRNSIKPVLSHYSSKSNFIKEDWTDSDAYQLNLRIDTALNKQNVQAVRGVPIHFLTGSQSKQIYNFATKLSKRFGMLAWNLDELVEQAKKNPEFKKETDQPLDKVSQNFLVGLIVRKIEKTNYKGPYLFTGYPRKEEDIRALRIVLLQEASFVSCTCCIHTPPTQNQEANNEKLQKYFTQSEKTPFSVVKAGDNAYNQIEFQISKTIPMGPPAAGKLVVLPSIGDEGADSPLTKSEDVHFVEFKNLCKKQIAEKHLYSDLIASNQTLDRPLPAPLATSIVLKTLSEQLEKDKAGMFKEKPLVVRGYPQTVEQTKALFSRATELRVLAAFIYQGDAPKGKQDRLKENKCVEAALELACNYFVKISDKTTTEEYKNAVSRFSSI